MIPIPRPQLTGAEAEAAEAVTLPARTGPEGRRRLVSIVCPVHNEEAAVDLFYGRLTRVLDPLRHEYDFEIIFTNNCSSDQTADRILRLREQDPSVQLLTYSRNFGQQASVMGGLRQAAGDAVIMIDVDCEDPPELIPEFLAGWKEGYDIVYGERNRRPEPIVVTWMRKIFYRLTKLIADDDIILDMAEFCLIDAQVRDAAAAGDDTHPFVRAEIARCGFRRKGIRYDRQIRVVGKSHYNLWRMSQFAVAGILSSTTAPLHAPIILLPPLLLANVALLALQIANLWRWGFPVLVCMDLLFLCGSVAGIGLYLARNYHSLIARPVVVVDWRHSALNTRPEQSPNALRRQGPPRDGA
jgi:dolichol-phosphate mannosyltransferase